MKKVIVIGSGPAGISAALYTKRAGMHTTIISNGLGNLEKAHEIENYYGVEGLSGRELALTGIRQAKALGIEFIEKEVVGISFDTSLVVETTDEKYPADYVVMATGSSRIVPAGLKVSDYEGKGVSYCAVCDAFFYRKKNVAVVGSGEFALHEILDIKPVVASVTLLTNGEEPSIQVPEGVLVDTRRITSLNGAERLQSISFEQGEDLCIDGLFVAYGVAGSSAFAKKIGAELENNRILVNENMETNIPGLYATGDCTGGLLQVAKAVYEGAVAGNHIAKVSKL